MLMFSHLSSTRYGTELYVPFPLTYALYLTCTPWGRTRALRLNQCLFSPHSRVESTISVLLFLVAGAKWLNRSLRSDVFDKLKTAMTAHILAFPVLTGMKLKPATVRKRFFGFQGSWAEVFGRTEISMAVGNSYLQIDFL